MYQNKVRCFVLQRDEDESGISGTGIVAEGVVFSNGVAVVNWLTEWKSTAVYKDIESVEKIHGHNGKTKIVYFPNVDLGEIYNGLVVLSEPALGMVRMSNVAKFLLIDEGKL
jgi:hypothetical protein